jgi:hypothetical protein
MANEPISVVDPHGGVFQVNAGQPLKTGWRLASEVSEQGSPERFESATSHQAAPACDGATSDDGSDWSKDDE